MSAVQNSQAEACDLCHAGLGERHQHLFDPAARRVECVCDACAVLFSGDGRTKYRRVPRRILFLPDFQMTDAQWEALMIPIGVAFFYRSSIDHRVMALYPSPAGAVESQLAFDAWEDIAAKNPIVRGMEPDVEGLLVYRAAESREYFLIPIDECFLLIGIMRLRWKGFSGGSALWTEVESFLAALRHSGDSPCRT
jgi:Family of unknown function (DUF5947)